ncbi:MAG: polysaccharide pyruvyl transferase family protein [Cyanobacteria bacterium]|nr:polysaccharide pyruvyl transferase family protein [Cyanobacteriota bacterium]
MKLCWYKLPNGERNFGDDLNPWLWEKLMPGILDDDNRVAFVGIGSLLNDGLAYRTRYATKRVIFGTGVGYGKGKLKLDESYKIYCVRGPLSAKSLGLEDEAAVTDGAALIRRAFSTAPQQKKYQFSYMPHYELAGEGWIRACEAIGFGYIDPRWTVERVLDAMGQTEVLLAEAMHGAIVADALRIPWIPIVTNNTILSFKWQDWCSSIGVEYRPVHIDRLHHPKSKTDVLTPVRRIRDKVRQNRASVTLKKVATDQSPSLSSDSHIESLTIQLEERLQRFKLDVERGLFLV